METERVFQINQVINDRLTRICEYGATDSGRTAIASEVRQLVTELCLAIVEANTNREPAVYREISIM